MNRTRQGRSHKSARPFAAADGRLSGQADALLPGSPAAQPAAVAPAVERSGEQPPPASRPEAAPTPNVAPAAAAPAAAIAAPTAEPAAAATAAADPGSSSTSSPTSCAALPSEGAWVSDNGAIADGTDISAGTALVPLSDTFRLSSNPSARTTIYLDFNGHTTTGTSWNDATMGASFISPAYDTDGNKASFGTNELTLIQRAWQRIAADFAPFDVNVTTLAPPDDWLIKSNSSDPNYGIRVVMTSYGPSSSTAGGIAYIDSFNWNSDTPCFVYNTSLLGVSEAVSHEVGHSLGLSHDGTLSGASYYQGHGSGETGWAPIMGVGYYQSVTQWDDGTYYNSNNGGTGANYNKGPDDLAIITSYNGFGYLADQVGNNQATSSALSIQSGNVSQFGTIETRADLDWYSFSLANPGSINLSFDPYWYRSFIDSDGLWGGAANPYYARVSDANTGTAWADNGTNLDLSVELYNSAGGLVASANPTGLAASLSVSNLAADTYFLRLDGVGIGSPTSSTPTGYSDYASIGSYLISGTITGADSVPEISLALTPSFSVSEDGSTNLVYTFSRAGDPSAALTVGVSLTGSASSSTDYVLSGSDGSTVTFAAGAATATVTVDPTADTTVEGDETVSLQLVAGSGYSLATTAAVVGTISNDDVPVVTLTVSPATVTEDGSPNLIYTFTRSFTSSQSLLVSYSVAGTASLGSDYTGPSTSGAVKTITIGANATTASLTVNPTADTLYEADETVELSLFPGFGYTIGTTTPVVGTISNDDLPVITLAVAPATVAENGGTGLVYTFSRDGLTSSALTVAYTIGGTATNGSDYGAIGTSITFQPNAATATLTVLPIDDALVEADETVALSLAANAAYRIGTTGAVTGTISNDDLPVISLAVAPASAAEFGSGTIVYTFSRSGPLGAPLTVNYSIGGTATNGVDYTAIGSSVTFQANAATSTVVIDPLSDSLIELDETVALTLQAGSGYVAGTTTAVLSTILNSDLPVISLALSPASVRDSGSDGPLLYTFSRSGPTTESLSVAFTVDGTASNGVDYTAIGNSISFDAGASTATLAIAPLADALINEGNETVAISLANSSTYTAASLDPVVGTLIDDLTPLISLSLTPDTVSEDNGTALLYSFSRSGDLTSGLTVAFSVGGTASADDYASIGSSVSFAAGAANATLAITPTADATIEADETIDLSLSAGSGYLISTPGVVRGTILNDDWPVVSLSLTPTAVAEDGGTALVYSFSRSGPLSAPLSISYAVAGTATAGSDYTGLAAAGASQTLNFAAGAATATLSLTPIADSTVESPESVELSLQAGSGYTIGTPAPVVGTILNDDLPSVSLAVSPSAVAEGGSTNLVYTFTRSVATSEPLTISYGVSGTASGGVDYASLSGSVTIAAGSSSADVSVDPTDDTTVESNETVVFSLLPGSGYKLGTTTTATGTINNDDLNPAPTAGADTLIFTPSQDSLTGLGGADSFQLIDLLNSLFVSSSAIDKVTSFVTSEDRFDSPFRTTAVIPTAAGSVSSLSTSAIASLLTSSKLVASGAATFTSGKNASLRTFLAINDNVAGYQSASDAIIEITGFSGALTSLQVL